MNDLAAIDTGQPGDFTSWVIGQGLVGGALNQISTASYRSAKFDWHSPHIFDQITTAADGFRQFTHGRSWAVVWAAGRGVVGTSAEEMAQETAALQRLISALHANRPAGEGALLMISSAGAVYAGSHDPPFDEFTEPQPLTAYGRAKQAQEDLVLAAASQMNVRGLVVRAANVYGRGQDMNKSQGLISHLCKSAVTRQPTNLYVSGDTMRHYVWNQDLAHLVSRLITKALKEQAPFQLMKVAASSQSTTVSELVGVVKRVSKVPVRVGLGAEARTNQQATDLRLNSRVWVDLDSSFQMPLVAGVKEVLDGFRFPLAIAS